MPAPDLQGPLDDFYKRTGEVKKIIVAIEAAIRSPEALTTSRTHVALSNIDAVSGNTTNAMSIVFIASSFEEFIREEIGQCADYLAGKYVSLHDDVKHSIRASYWKGSLESLRFIGPFLTRSDPRVPNPVSIGKIRNLLDSARGFVVDDDASQLNRTVFYRHSHNFRPHVVDEVGARLGIKNLIKNAADSGRIKTYFGVSKKNESYDKLRAKLDEFYERRNEIVHSLSGVTGYAVDVVLDYIAVFEMTAESIKLVLSREIAGW